MQLQQILAELDLEIERLQRARALIAGTSDAGRTTPFGVKRKPGRPAGGAKLTAESRRHIAEAMKRSWARRKKQQAAGTKATKKK